jgi:hypothetical protein
MPPIVSATDLLRLVPPDSTLEGWALEGPPTEYVPETLYEYLDGAAERYVSFGVSRLLHVRYRMGEDSPAGVTLDIFDMGSDLGAFGIYRSGLPPGASLRAWGAEGCRFGTVGAAWAGSVYVHAEADDDRPGLIAGLERMVVAVCDRVPGDAALPPTLTLFPENGLVPRSERYVAADLLGHAFLPGGFVADYAVDGGEVRLFFSDLGREEHARDALGRLHAHQVERAETVREEASIGSGGFRYRDRFLGRGRMVRFSGYVAGAYGDVSDDALDRLLDQFLTRLAEAPGARK